MLRLEPSLRSRLMMLMLLGASPIILILAYMGYEAHRVRVQHAFDDIDVLVRTVANTHANRIEALHVLLHALTQVSEVQNGRGPACQMLLATVIKANEHLANIGVIQPDGRVSCSAVPVAGNVNLADREYFKRALRTRQLVTSRYVLGRLTGKSVFVIALPHVASGRVKSVVYVAMDLAWLSRVIAQLPLPPRSTVTLLDREGTVLLRLPEREGLIGTTVLNLREGPWALARIKSTLDSHFSETGVDGHRRFYTFRPLSAGDVPYAYLTVGITEEAIHGEARSQLVLSMTLVTISLLVMFALVWFGSQPMLLRRLEPVFAAIRRVAAGDLGARTGLPPQDDSLGRLALEVDAMASTLQEHQQAIARANTALRLEKARLQLSVDSAGIGLWEANLQTGQRYYSPEWKRQIGYGPDELDDSVDTWESRLHPDDHDRVINAIVQYQRGEAARYDTEFRLRHRDGSWRWILSRGTLQRDDHGQAAWMIGVHVDITATRQAQEALRQGAEQLRSISAHVPGLVFRLVRQAGRTVFEFVSDGVRDLCGRRPEQFMELDHFLALVVQADRDGFARALDESLSTLAPVNWEGRIDVDTQRKWVNVRASARRHEGGVCWDGVMLNITLIRHANDELLRAHNEIRELTMHQEIAREEEKRSIAREIHDELGATLTAIKMDAHWAGGRLAGASEAIARKLHDIRELADTAIQATRRISTELHPRVLDDLGLVAAIEWLTGEFERRYGIACQYRGPDHDIDIEPKRGLALFRILQESLTNVARHAGATAVEVELALEGERARLRVSDNGCGLPPGRPGRATSHGVRGMVERARYFGGEVRVENTGAGTRVTAVLPLAPKTEIGGEGQS
jgi:PAS domain S-box-containing protein